MNEPASTVNITFESPPRNSPPRTSSHHHRDLEGIPESTAHQMAQDFTTSQHEPSMVSEKKLYTYEPAGPNKAGNDTRFIALDFEEIVTLEVVEPAAVAVPGRA